MKERIKRDAKAKIKFALIALCFIGFIFILCLVTARTAIRVLYPMKYEEIVIKYCEEYGVNEALAFAVIETESGFDPQAESEAGAIGLMQMLPETFEWLQSKTGESYETKMLKDEEISVKYGIYFLSILKEEFKSDETVLAAYHAGMGKVSEWLSDSDISDDGITLKKIPYSDTRH